jgi:hypothetical protein
MSIENGIENDETPSYPVMIDGIEIGVVYQYDNGGLGYVWGFELAGSGVTNKFAHISKISAEAAARRVDGGGQEHVRRSR